MSNAALPVENIPQCLRDLPQWVCWRYVERDGKKTKVPVCVASGLNASSTDSATWTTFDAAHEAYQRSSHLVGVGFVFTKDAPFAGVDLDRCLDEQGNFLWGQEIVEQLATYTEVSPSGRGVKLFLRAKKPAFARCRRDGFGPERDGEIEIYDQGRFFVVTGRRLEHLPADVAERQAEFDALCTRLWPSPNEVEVKPASADRPAECLRSMLAMRVTDHRDGSHRLFAACCRCIEHDLSDAEAVACIRTYERVQPFPAAWSDTDIVRRLRDAERQCRRGEHKKPSSERIVPSCKSVGQLLTDHPELRKPVIHGLLRQGETANLIAPSKVGKSWLVTDLALSLATGRPWLDTFATEAGNVLILDNELHHETTAHRIPQVADARDISLTEIADTVFVDNLRGRLKDIFSLGPYFDALQPNFFKIIVMDALYRFLPKDADENSNGNLTDIYNQLDCYAGMLGCSFVLVHHVSKGNQAGKSVTDVGAGAGSQSRATDTHFVLRPHEQDGVVVLDAAVRSWPPIEPRCLRWTFPVWNPADDLDPAALRPERPRRPPKSPATEAAPTKQPSAWDARRFVESFVRPTPATILALTQAAIDAGLSERKATKLLKQAESQGLIHRWRFGATHPVQLATIPQSETSV
jgi:hypothetical protein